MSPKEKLTEAERREIILKGIRGESVTELSKLYGVARSWIYVLIDDARKNAEAHRMQAGDDFDFWNEVCFELNSGEE